MKMNLSDRQREEINRAVADYLQNCGYLESLQIFKQEASLSENDHKTMSGMLEKKWTSVLRLQKKVNDLEAKLAEAEKEINHGAPSREATTGRVDSASTRAVCSYGASSSYHSGSVSSGVECDGELQ